MLHQRCVLWLVSAVGQLRAAYRRPFTDHGDVPLRVPAKVTARFTPKPGRAHGCPVIRSEPYVF